MRQTSDHPPAQTLERFGILHELGAQRLGELARRLFVHTAGKGEALLEYGSKDPAALFLLRGRLRLTAVDGAVQTIADQDPAATRPVARLRPSRYEVRALTPVEFLRIPPEYLDGGESPGDPGNTLAGYEVNEEGNRDTYALQDQLSTRLHDDLRHDRLLLPSLPDVAVRVGKAVADEAADAPRVARAVEADPAISAKLLKAANSARFGGLAPVRTVEEAVVRLGLRTTYRLVVTFALRELFRCRASELNRQMQALWDHSRRVAALSHALGRRLEGFDPDFALLAGLVHDLGAVAVLAYAGEQPAELVAAADLAATVAQLRGEIGARLVERWRLPEELAAIARHAEDWHYEAAEGAGYLDIVIIAQLHSYVGSDRQQRLPPIDGVPAYGRLGLGALSPTASLQLLDEAREEIQATELLLGG